MKKLLTAVLALACFLTLARSVYAAANANLTEFGVEGDLTVLGLTGTTEDPDVAIKGFTVFGSTQTDYPGPVDSGAGNVVINGYLAVSSGAYFVGNSTFTATVNLPVPGSIMVSGAAGNGGKVLTSDGTTGLLKWGDVTTMVSGDNLGNHTATETLKMAAFGIVNVSSIAVNNWLTVGTTMTVTGLTTLSTASVTGSLAVAGYSQLGDLPGTDYVGINGAADNTTALKVTGENVSNKYSATFYSGTNLAAWIKRK